MREKRRMRCERGGEVLAAQQAAPIVRRFPRMHRVFPFAIWLTMPITLSSCTVRFRDHALGPTYGFPERVSPILCRVLTFAAC